MSEEEKAVNQQFVALMSELKTTLPMLVVNMTNTLELLDNVLQNKNNLVDMIERMWGKQPAIADIVRKERALDHFDDALRTQMNGYIKFISSLIPVLEPIKFKMDTD